MMWRVVALLGMLGVVTCVRIRREGQGCRKTPLGQEYNGSKAETVSGKTCRDWSFYEGGLPEKNFRAAKNFCRNPDGEAAGPWCYTNDPDVLWEFCGIEFCRPGGPRDCKMTLNGQDYHGTARSTKSGKSCKFWDFLEDNLPEKAFASAGNFCRNPDGELEGPWCYTTDPDTLWETCGIEQCE